MGGGGTVLSISHPHSGPTNQPTNNASSPPINQVNIANLTLGRQDSDLALCLMSVDGQVPEEAIKDLRALPQLNDVRTAKLGAGSK